MRRGLLESKVVNIIIAIAVLVVLLIILIKAGSKGNSVWDSLKNLWRVFA
ncbi:MAG: hypothetical protein AABW87_01545 [Nanoarchaeota archaeon]